MENRGPLIPILILDKPAKNDMIVRVDDVSISAAGKLHILYYTLPHT